MTTPDSIEELISMLQRVLDKHFKKPSARSSNLGIFLLETIITFEQTLFEGLSRLFTQIQYFLPKEQRGKQRDLDDSFTIAIDHHIVPNIRPDDTPCTESDISQIAEISLGEDSFLREYSQDTPLEQSNSFDPLSFANADSLEVVPQNLPEQEWSFATGENENSLLRVSLEGENNENQNWEDLEIDWFPELANIRNRRTSSLPQGILSPAEVEQFVASLCDQSPSGIPKESAHENFGGDRLNLLTIAKSQIDRLRNLAPGVKTVHYLAYLFQRHHKNLPLALEELHRYFDLQVYQEPENSSPNENSPSMLIFSVLNLASLHYHFENYFEGLEALREALRMAQARSDKNSLVLILYWLYCFLQKIPRSSLEHSPSIQLLINQLCALQSFQGNSSAKIMEELLNRGTVRADEQNLSYWVSLNLLALSQLKLHSAQKSEISVAVNQHPIWEIIQQLSKVNIRSSVSQMITKAHLVHSSIWDSFGHKDLTELYTKIPIQDITSNQILPEDLCTSYCKLAYQCMESGKFDKAFQTLLDLRQKHLKPFSSESSNFLLCASSLLIQYATLRCEFQIGMELLQQNIGSRSLSIDQLEHQARLYLCKREFLQVSIIVRKLDQHLQTHLQDPLLYKQRLRVYILLAELYQKTSQPAMALSYVLPALSLCTQYQLYSLHAEVCVLLAEIHLDFDQLDNSFHLIQSVLPQIMHHCSVKLRSRTFLFLAKLGVATFRTKLQSLDDLLACLEYLSKALAGFAKLEAVEYLREAHYYQALIYSLLPSSEENLRQRTIAAGLFKHLDLLISQRSLTKAGLNFLPGSCAAELANTLLTVVTRVCNQ